MYTRQSQDYPDLIQLFRKRTVVARGPELFDTQDAPWEPSGWQVWGVGGHHTSGGNVVTWKQNSEYAGFSPPHMKKHHLLPSGRRASTIPLPPRAVTRNPAFITDRTARPLALAITWAAKVRDNR